MDKENIGSARLTSQWAGQDKPKTAHEVVSWMGAMQAQDHAGALWAIALRTPNLTLADIEKEITERKIVRTWPMRGTLHYVAAEDLRWMQTLLTPRIVKNYAGRRAQLGIDDATLAKAEEIIKNSLKGTSLTRGDLYQLFEDGGINPAGQKGIHMIGYFAHMGLVCHGAHIGKQPTYALVDDWIGQTDPISREESLKRLAQRYFKSHGPTTVKDFAGWGFMTMADAKLGLELAKDSLKQVEIDGAAHWLDKDTDPKTSSDIEAFLLPGFDEFILGYKDRSAVATTEHMQRVLPGGNGVFLPTIVIDGHVAGLWKKTVRKSGITITLEPFRRLSTKELKALEKPAARYGQFLDVPVAIAT